MSSQKALYLEKKNGAFVLRDRDIPALTASKPGSPVELLVKVHAAAANPIDWKMQKFGLLLKDDQYPLIIGFDVAGEVMAIGEGGNNSAGFVVGDRMWVCLLEIPLSSRLTFPNLRRQPFPRDFRAQG
ncbi:hypothetical protein PM082_019177 [Marasmius tenuissimus]|nr:hypothetical protein PM082_019177 [Marasmius tenuissimus]